MIAGRTPPRLSTVVLVGLGAALLLLALDASYGRHDYSDFRIFWQAGRDAWSGASPYPQASATALHGQDQFVYPAPAAVAMVPFGWLPLPIAAGLFLMLSAIAMAASLYLMDVRDPRCYAVCFGALPVIQSLTMGTVTPLLMLAMAIAWRHRERRVVAGAALAVAIALKLFLAPILLWPLCRRRIGLIVSTSVATAALVLGGWALIGFRGLTSYPALLSALTTAEGHAGYAPYPLLLRLGAPPTAARLAVCLLVAGIAALAWATRRSRPEPATFALAVVACLVFSPIVWLNYFAVLYLAIAALRPAFGWVWFLPAAFWFFPNANLPAAGWKILAAQLLLAVLAASALGWRAPSRLAALLPRRAADAQP